MDTPQNRAIRSYLAGQEVTALRREVLALLERHAADPGTVAVVLADVIAYACAEADRRAGGRHLQDRLHAFLARVEETYERVLAYRGGVPGAGGGK